MVISCKLVSAIDISGNLHPTKNIICRSKYDITTSIPVLRYVLYAGEPDRYGIARSGNNGYLYGSDLVNRDYPWCNAFIGNVISIGVKIIEIEGIDIPGNLWCGSGNKRQYIASYQVISIKRVGERDRRLSLISVLDRRDIQS